MCSYQEWERLTRRLQEGIDEGPLREFLADAVARVELLGDELKGWSCAPENADWACGRGRRSRTEWVA
jgi:hypothetical protein